MLQGAEGVYDRRRGAATAGIFTPTCELDLLVGIGDQHHAPAVALDDADVCLGDFLAVDQQLPSEDLAGGLVRVNGDDGARAMTLDEDVQEGHRLSTIPLLRRNVTALAATRTGRFCAARGVGLRCGGVAFAKTSGLRQCCRERGTCACA